ncbi:hypothetical protein G6O69_31055 [Pseudenhygromyxa sp. WMMC2535]|uniref:hypothetical protein n=1 Tax=Pseudenhygromyxa sp. WMMC2535 TaxID=2712867 RepID=UPI001553E1F7|nr:hypothetical protein [Pseudenhygromyxa sp. WMMC2535]NVB42303.1 hypothetical protein [Pseudenhygromyxa sp. WMMC2535]
MHTHRYTITALVLVGLAGVTACDDGVVIVPDDPTTTAIYETLSTQWWSWSYGIEGQDHPILDPDGSSCGLGDVSDELFFLAGTAGGAATRSCQVPTGKALFFPLINGVNLNHPDDPQLPAEDLAAALGGVLDLACDLELSLDGAPMLTDFDDNRVAAGPFAMEVVKGQFNDDPEGTLPPGIYDPTVSDGYWALVTPLSPGDHVLEFGGSLCVDGQPIFTTQVTYNLAVGDYFPNEVSLD